MTAKSIATYMEELRRSGGLQLYNCPLRPGKKHKRRIWLHPSVWKWLHQTRIKENEIKFFDDVKATLRNFVAGADFDDDNLLKPVRGSSGMYSMRLLFTPQYRIFGYFIRPGEFVAISYSSRDKLDKIGWIKSRKQASDWWQARMQPFKFNISERSELLKDFQDE